VSRGALAALVAMLAAVRAATLLPAVAAARPIIDDGDAAELAQELAEATAAQQVCYGWNIRVQDFGGSEEGIEAGSSQGPGAPLDRSQCQRFVELVGEITYTSETSDAEDSASWRIESNLGRPPTIREIEDLGYDTGDLLGDRDDEELINAVGALPRLVADHGEARSVAFEPNRQPVPPQDRPTGSPGNDFLRQNGATVVICLLLVLGGLAWGFARLRSGGKPSYPSRPPTPSTPPPET